MTIQELRAIGRVISQSRIDGEFEGFNDSNLFPLVNGQYWKQSRYQYWYHYAYRPRVTIYEYQNRHYFTVDSRDRLVEVIRVYVSEHTIVNDFRGWDGKTIFQMENGEIWQQNEYGYWYHYEYRPKAVIYQAGTGDKILVSGKSVGVKRLK